MATTVESLRKAIGKKKTSRAYAWLADLKNRAGDVDGALECVQKGLSEIPCEEGHLVLSKLLVSKGDWDGVIESCKYVLVRNPYCLSAIRRMGDAYEEKGDVENRNQCYRHLHDLDPLDPFWKEEYAPTIDVPAEENAEAVPAESAEASEGAESASVPAAEASDPDVLDRPLSEVSDSSDGTLEKAPEETAPAAESAIEKAPEPENAEEDPFLSLSTLLPVDEDQDGEVSFDDLEHSLDDAIAGFAPENKEQDAFPTDEIGSDDISTALSGIFGASDPDEASELPEPSKPAETKAPEPAAEDKPQSLSDAFDSIFGEDELPEEFDFSGKPFTSSLPTEETEPAAESAPVETAPSAASTPVESPANEELPTESDASPFEKSSLSEAPSLSDAASAPAEESSEGTLEKSVESSFDSLFGESSDDDLPLESLTSHVTPAEDTAPSAASTPVESPASEELPAESDLSPFEKSSLSETPSLSDAASAPAEESSEGTLEKSVESSFDSLFGESSDDDLPLESLTSHVTPAKETAPSENPADEELPSESDPSPFEKSSLSEASSLSDAASPAPSEPSEGTLEKSVESSFDSLFGESSDDDLPLENLTSHVTPAEETAPSADTAPVESPADEELPAESDASPFEKSSLSETPSLSDAASPAPSEPSEGTLEKSVESSFDSLFGESSDDALDEDPTTGTRTLAEIYFEQGVYSEAARIYRELLKKNPGDEALQARLEEIEKIGSEGNNSN